MVIKTLKYTGIAIGSLLFLMFAVPKLFPGKIEEEIKAFANKKLNGELNFKGTELSFFSHFPSLTLTLTDFSLNGSAPFEKQNLVKAKNIAFGVNLKSLLFERTVKIDEIYVSDADINVQVNKNGQANYNVYIAQEEAPKKDKDTKETSLKLDRIQIENTHLTYNDKSIAMLVNAKGFNYLGKGDFDSAIFDLVTEANIESFDFSFGGEEYLKHKKINANLITQINTTSLAFVFQQNDLVVNQLPIDFKGKLDFLKDGYDMDFSVKSANSNLHDVFTAMPPQYVKWLNKTEIKGTTDLLLTLKGEYNVARNRKPDLAYKMKIKDGFVNYNASKYPASKLQLDLYTQLPALDLNKLIVQVKPLSFAMGKDYFKAQIETVGLTTPSIKANLQSNIDLQKLHEGLGIQNIDFSGKLIANMVAQGQYDAQKRLLPKTQGTLVLQNGSIKTPWYPNPITAIYLTTAINNATGQYKDLQVKITPATFNFEGKKIDVRAALQNFDDLTYDVKAKGEIDLGRVYKVFTQENLDIKGIVKANLALKGKQSDADKGRYHKLQNSGTLFLKDITLRSGYLAKPFVINQGLFTFNQNQMSFKNFLATYGQSDFTMNGSMQNVINFAMSDKAILKGQFKVASNYINVDEFTAGIASSSSTTSTSTANSSVVIVPPTVDFNLLTTCKKVNFEGLAINQLNSQLNMRKGELSLKNTGFELIGCNVKMNATYKNLNTRSAKFDYQITAKDFDVKRAYNEVKMFRDMVSAAKTAEGIVSLDYGVSGYLNQDMKPIYPSLKGKGTLSVKAVKMKGFKLFNAISKTTNYESIQNPDLSQIDIKSIVKNNIMTLEQFKFKVAGFRPKIAGQVSLDGRLNLKMRLGLPPLGIIGIPLKITGTQDKPQIKITKKFENLEETNFEEKKE